MHALARPLLWTVRRCKGMFVIGTGNGRYKYYGYVYEGNYYRFLFTNKVTMN